MTVDRVAPRAGAWVETFAGGYDGSSYRESHPVRVRGLKLVTTRYIVVTSSSHSVRVRGLKLDYTITDWTHCKALVLLFYLDGLIL